jgi:serine/threonine protein kinase
MDSTLREPIEGNEDEADGPFTAAALASLFPDLKVLEPIGRGGMGLVCKARQIKLDRLVALKLIRPELAQHPAFFDRFSREARAMARLSHPNIVMIHDFGETGGVFHLVMELVEGTDLRQRLLRGALEPRSAILLALQICNALEYAHERGVIHRDIKPENVLLDRVHGVKIADFGLAKLLLPGSQEGMTSTRHVLGTPYYMAPEQMDRPGHVDHRADIYSLGVVLYEMLAGVVPYGRYELLSDLVGTEEELDEVVGKALSRKPSDRYDSVAELHHDLTEIAEEAYELQDPVKCISETMAEETKKINQDAKKNAIDWSWLGPFTEWLFKRKSPRKDPEPLI